MFKKFQEASKEFCSTRWHLSWAKYLQGSFPNSDVERLVTQCFKSVWVTAALHEGLLFPPGYGHLTSAPNTVHGQVVHWTLGALLYRTRFFPLRYEDTKIYCYKRTKKMLSLKPEDVSGQHTHIPGWLILIFLNLSMKRIKP